jgi:mannose-1-phosphate guanylyltransferase / mannose-6-phosphate isomerase
MEPAAAAGDVAVVTATFAWDDVGAWDALYDHLPADAQGVITRGEVLAIDCADSLVVNHSRLVVAGVGLVGLSVVVTDDAVLILPKGRSQEVKQVVNALATRRPAVL